MRAMPRLCELYPGICLATDEKSRKNFSQGSRSVPVGTMKTEYTEQNMYSSSDVVSCNVTQNQIYVCVSISFITTHKYEFYGVT